MEHHTVMAPAQAHREHLGDIAGTVEAIVMELLDDDALRRIHERDHTLWRDDPTEVADRLGWLDCPTGWKSHVPELEAFAERVAADGLGAAVLLGMGGSSLFPEVLAQTFGAAPGHLDVRILDSTDPAAVRRVHKEVDPPSTLFVVASKSGTTVETGCHLDYFHRVAVDALGEDGAGARFCAITDPGSPLEEIGHERGFRRVFLNRTDIGGRYSALSDFGLVPAALLGVDILKLLEGGADMIDVAHLAQPERHPALRLGAIMAAGAEEGRDKLTLVLPDEVVAFGAWIEQLVAESLGKDGEGLVPVVGDALDNPAGYGDDRLFVALGDHPGADTLKDQGHPVIELPYGGPQDLGAEVVRWELATAIAGCALGVNPFDQPDVAAAKQATAQVLTDGLPDVSPVPAEDLLAQVKPGDYVALTAFVDPFDGVVDELQRIRVALRDRLGSAVTLGIGPRYLHSTGQLHKGGPASVVVLQVLGADAEDLPIPDRDFGFSTLKQAQAAGDLEALARRDVRAGRVTLDDLRSAAGRDGS